MSRPVKRVQYTWRVLWDPYGTPGILTAAGGAEDEQQTALISKAELEDLDDNIKIKRVVGEIYFFFQAADGSSALPLMQLTQGLVINRTSQAPTFSFATATAAQDDPWIWLRNYMLVGSQQSSEGGTASHLEDAGGLMAAHLDVPVNRRLGEGDQLFLVSQAHVSGATAWNCFIWRRLRILCEV